MSRDHAISKAARRNRVPTSPLLAWRGGNSPRHKLTSWTSGLVPGVKDLNRRSHLTPPLPLPSQIGVDLRGVHPRSSQIGVAFSDEASIGAGLTGLRFRAMSCDSGDLALPPPLFFDFRCKQSTYSIRRLGLPCATLGWPLGHPWVTQGSPNRKPNPNPNEWMGGIPSRQRVASPSN